MATPLTNEEFPSDMLPESVRDTRLPVAFRQKGSHFYTVHSRRVQFRTRASVETWRHKKPLGRGGYGRVELQLRELDDVGPPQYRAVKSISLSNAEMRSKRDVCTRELEALAKFSKAKYSDCFVAFHGWYSSPGWLHIAMEYLELGDLQKYLSDRERCPNGRLPESQAQHIAAQVLGAISMMHEEGFAHRDLKPSNLLIKSQPPDEWWIKLCDLGLSKRILDAQASTTVRGTLGFIAPELLGFNGDPRTADPYQAEMWSVGETIYQLLTGQPTFKTDAEFSRYCSDNGRFPQTTLKDLDISELGIAFLTSIMMPEPTERLSCGEACKHKWTEPYLDTKNDTASISNPSHDIASPWEWPPGHEQKSETPRVLTPVTAAISDERSDDSKSEDALYILPVPSGPDSATSDDERSRLNATPDHTTATGGTRADTSADKKYYANSYPVHDAVLYDRLDDLKQLLEGGAGLNDLDDSGQTPLHLAADLGQLEAVKLLLDFGADTSIADKKGITAFVKAVVSREIEAAKQLVRKGADPLAVDNEGRTAMHYVAMRGHLEEAEFLHGLGVNLSQQDSNGLTPIGAASHVEEVQMVRWLLNNGADFATPDHNGYMPLHYAVSSNRMDLVEILMRVGAEHALKTKLGDTTLNLAVSFNTLEVARALIDMGVDIEARDDKGRTVLQRAVLSGNHDAVKLLVEKGADIMALSTNGRSTLHFAQEPKIAEFLLQSGVDVEEEDNYGWTALHHACSYGYLEMAKILLKHGADQEARNRRGSTPRDLAKQSGKFELVKLLSGTTETITSPAAVTHTDLSKPGDAKSTTSFPGDRLPVTNPTNGHKAN